MHPKCRWSGNEMLLRRISKHVKDQNWTAIGIDFFIVVFGVFIGIQVANWNVELGERALEAEYRLLLASDLRAIDATLAEQHTHEAEIITGVRAAFEEISAAGTGSDAISIGQSLMPAWGRRTLTLESPTFTELKGAGRLTVIQDTALRSKVIGYFEQLNRIELIAEKNNDFLVEPFTAFLRDSGIGFVPIEADLCDTENVTVQCFANNELLAIAQGQKTHSADSILNAPVDDPIWRALRAHLAFRTMAAVSNMRAAEDAQTQTREIIAMLEAAP